MAQWFNARKAAQVAAYLAMRQGGTINVMKLVKLIYLADREFMTRYDSPILFDRLVSMPHGPVNSMTYNYMGGAFDDAGWNAFIADREGHDVALASINITPADFDQLSEAEVEVMGIVWGKFGHMTQWEIRDYTHTHCPEWEDPQGSSLDIPYERVFKFLGKAANASELAGRVEAERILAGHFGG